ncbi:fungal-specific transcription factor domain-containing protein [Stachybotrys elegans]|uniref:Fungal-specific transcription factor domain-containing protein n=1 Tax=Stachybotrys elegans TaxID=80388 RepID=A0A8K0WRX1_9HYPO|nr:fungal-specific transcription factor domain-containing protein [Stachybotrys elegans]
MPLNPASSLEPKPRARACLLCRAKKTRCDGQRPQCAACKTLGEACEYRFAMPRQRPTFSRIHELEARVSSLESFIKALHVGSSNDRNSLLNSAVDAQGTVTVPSASPSSPSDEQNQPPGSSTSQDCGAQPEPELSIAHFVSRDDSGDGSTRNFGPSSALHVPGKNTVSVAAETQHHLKQDEKMRDTLIANAALQRQLEHQISKANAIQGVPTNIALRLLDCHWSRQHHSFLLTYRPAIMRDLRSEGPHATPFLINAIFACSSKFSGLLEVWDDPTDPTSAGQRFLDRCDSLLAQEGLLTRSSIPTVVGLLLLGSTYVARGETTKGWLYSGYALRMVYELGLHLDPTETTDVPEEVEVRRRVFWGAFVCDKLQSLYLGRPVVINIRDSRVSHHLFDTYEEMELYAPTNSTVDPSFAAVPIHSVSTFQQLCRLSEIMTTIINIFYVVGATIANAAGSLETVETALHEWKDKLPPELDLQPPNPPQTAPPPMSPNIMVMHSLYHTLIILVHRPFISDGHMRAAGTPLRSWERCSEASHHISHIVRSFRSAFTLASAPYVLGYTIYVACTIHVRNVASQTQHASLLREGLRWLEELCIANPGISRPLGIIKRMMSDNGLELDDGSPPLNEPIPLDSVMNDIINMFPGPELGFLETAADGSLYPQLSYDPIFGFMDSMS